MQKVLQVLGVLLAIVLAATWFLWLPWLLELQHADAAKVEQHRRVVTIKEMRRGWVVELSRDNYPGYAVDAAAVTSEQEALGEASVMMRKSVRPDWSAGK